jgi:hypothetical protein
VTHEVTIVIDIQIANSHSRGMSIVPSFPHERARC